MSLFQVPLSDDCALIFDLDDTLYPERSYISSGFFQIALAIDPLDAAKISQRLGELYDAGNLDAIGTLLAEQGIEADKSQLLQIYRDHLPDIKLRPGVRSLLKSLASKKKPLGILTDGRSVAQRNKIRALGLESWIQEIVISEEFGSGKPEERNYRYFEQVFPNCSYVYVGDNFAKDFVTPNRLGWTTIGLIDQGHNIHAQEPQQVPNSHHPQFLIEKIV